MHARQIRDATDMMQSESMQVVTRLTLSKDRDMSPALSMPKPARRTEGYNHRASFHPSLHIRITGCKVSPTLALELAAMAHVHACHAEATDAGCCVPSGLHLPNLLNRREAASTPSMHAWCTWFIGRCKRLANLSHRQMHHARCSTVVSVPNNEWFRKSQV